LLALVAILLQQDAPPMQSFDTRLDTILRDRRFDFFTWTARSIAEKSWESLLGVQSYLTEPQRKQFVLDYLTQVGRIQELSARIEAIYADPDESDPRLASADLRRELADLIAGKQRRQPIAESIIQEQITAVLADDSFGWLGQVFPPVAFRFTPLPMQLVISPRNQIAFRAQASLGADMPLEEQIAVEDRIDAELDVSSLVVPLGGLAMYPAMLLESASLEWTIKDAAHEWTHHWLLLRPLGWNYESSGETRTINETVASVVGVELGNAVLTRFYPEFAPKPAPKAAAPTTTEASTSAATTELVPVFSFSGEMHTTRLRADQLLAAGRIEEAEQYMEERREFFMQNGYLIRKINQAYFAFYGAYANQPGERGEDPIGPAVVRLREQTHSLRAFLDAIAPITTLAELQRLTTPTTNGN
jgi:hypothetical protein